MFKVGEMVECVRSIGGQPILYDGKRYVITSIKEHALLPGQFIVEINGDTTRTWNTDRFKRIDGSGELGNAFVPVTLSFGASPPPAHDVFEEKLRAIFLSVPPNCCAKCAAPLPCKYH